MNLTEFIDIAIGVPFVDGGRDFNGWDCWGPIFAAYRECYGINLPDFRHISALSSEETETLFELHKKSWIEIPIQQEIVGDVILLRHGSWSCHTGLIVKKNYMLHVDAKINTCVEPYNQGTWKTRVVGIYRHAELAS